MLYWCLSFWLSSLCIMGTNKTITKTNLVSLVFVTFICLYFIYFCSDIYDFLPSISFRFCLFFSISCFRCKFRLFVWNVSSLLRKNCIAINFPLTTAFAASHKFWTIVLSFSFVSRCIFFNLFDFFNGWICLMV